MISICTVYLEAIRPFLDIFLDSVQKNMSLVKEVILARVDVDEKTPTSGYSPPNVKYRLDSLRNGLRVTEIGIALDSLRWHAHALGLHECVDAANEEFIWFSDPDVFFYTNLDRIYMDLLKEHNLNYIGVSHHAAVHQAYMFFPCIMNSLVRKADLPGPDFMKGHLKIRKAPLLISEIPEDDLGEPANGKYLLGSPVRAYWDQFPNKIESRIYDAGCNLWLWSQQQKWRWLSFQTADCHTYTTGYYRSNCGIAMKKKQKLLYHATSSYHDAVGNGDLGRAFQAEYNKLLEEPDD